ncbi:MAG TPA: BPSS1780 family membrane protein [Albitalea sp.]|nr:BPSS1780 family membrane protein [Albitalea sp.]
MKFRHVPARQGAVWVRQGLRVFFRRPLAFGMLLFIYMFAGPLLMFTVAPLATVGFMIATRQSLEGGFPFATVFLQPLQAGRAQRWAQVRLGIAYAVGIGLVFWLADAVGGASLDALREAVATGRTAPEQLEPLLADPALQWGWLILVAGISLLAVPFWHAPALVHWGGLGAAKSLFFSTVACWRNKGALLVFSLGWAALVVLFALLSNLLFALLGMPQLAFAVVTPAMLIVSAAFYASLYFSFADSFEWPASAPPSDTVEASR